MFQYPEWINTIGRCFFFRSFHCRRFANAFSRANYFAQFSNYRNYSLILSHRIRRTTDISFCQLMPFAITRGWGYGTVRVDSSTQKKDEVVASRFPGSNENNKNETEPKSVFLGMTHRPWCTEKNLCGKYMLKEKSNICAYKCHIYNICRINICYMPYLAEFLYRSMYEKIIFIYVWKNIYFI